MTQEPTRWCTSCGEPMEASRFRATKAARRRVCRSCDNRRRMRARYLAQGVPIPTKYREPQTPAGLQRAIVDLERRDQDGDPT